MKARVKATGDIVEISEDCSYVYAEHFDKSYNINELEFLPLSEKSFPKEEDYWTRFEHQAAIAAMQGIMSNIEQITPKKNGRSVCDEVIDMSLFVAHELVEKLKKEEEK